jgi:hypothetical protein
LVGTDESEIAGFAAIRRDRCCRREPNCTFVEVDGRIIDAGTGQPAGMKSPCVVSEGTFGYDVDAQRQASADVQRFLKVLLKLE